MTTTIKDDDDDRQRRTIGRTRAVQCNAYLLDDLLVGVEVIRQTREVVLDDRLGGLLDQIGANASLE
jgi:hypothetical protein